MATATATIVGGGVVVSQQHQHSIQMLHQHVTSGGLPHGLGLLTTVASLPPKYRSRYLSIQTKTETPLDLTVKQPTTYSPQIANDVPIAASFTEVYTEPYSNSNSEDCCSSDSATIAQHINNEAKIEFTTLTNAAYQTELEDSTTTTSQDYETFEVAETVVIETTTAASKSPMTPPPTPTKRKLSNMLDDALLVSNQSNENHISTNDVTIEPTLIVERIVAENYVAENPTKMAKTTTHPTIKRETTPVKPIRNTDAAPPKTIKSQPQATKSTKNKATRKLKFDEETSSPVSGTIIRPLEDITDGTVQYSNGDIDPKYNIVEITEETKAELAAIKNVIGDYICKLCRLKFDDAFGLAQHRCACIVLLEYRCPECGKQFNCPANLASHRRWHKPKKDGGNGSGNGVGGGAAAKKENRNTTNQLATAPKSASNAATATLFACSDCGKKFKRQAYLKKHQLTHAKVSGVSDEGKQKIQAKKINNKRIGAAGELATGIYQTFNGSNSTSMAASSTASTTPSLASSASSSASSLHSYNGAHDDEIGAVGGRATTIRYVMHDSAGDYSSNYNYIDDIDDRNDGVLESMSDCSNSSSTGYGRLQIVESGLTEEENIAATALTNLRNCASVIQHTTLAH